MGEVGLERAEVGELRKEGEADELGSSEVAPAPLVGSVGSLEDRPENSVEGFLRVGAEMARGEEEEAVEGAVADEELGVAGGAFVGAFDMARVGAY